MNGGPVQRRKAHRERRPQHFRYGRLIPAADGLRPGAQPSLESVQHFLERGGGLRHGGACRRRFRKGVQHHKIMMRVVVTHAGHMHAGFDQLAGVCLALIAQHVVFRRDDRSICSMLQTWLYPQQTDTQEQA